MGSDGETLSAGSQQHIYAWNLSHGTDTPSPPASVSPSVRRLQVLAVAEIGCSEKMPAWTDALDAPSACHAGLRV
jgi:hypothetical protein